jgi:hypothetical protein
MKRFLSAFLIFTMVSMFPSGEASAVNSVKAGAICAKLNMKTISSGIKLQCLKSGKKLVWKSTDAVILKPTSGTSPTPTPTPSTSPTPTPSALEIKPRYYIANDQSTVQLLKATDACSNPKNASFEIQALVGTRMDAN